MSSNQLMQPLLQFNRFNIGFDMTTLYFDFLPGDCDSAVALASLASWPDWQGRPPLLRAFPLTC